MKNSIEPIYVNIGQRLRFLRELRGWRQEDVAEKAGLTRTSIVNIEGGRQRIMLHDIRIFAKIFKIGPENLTKGGWK